jgi:hypothetical protein
MARSRTKRIRRASARLRRKHRSASQRTHKVEMPEKTGKG